ncbi:MAG: baseplate J/gp47 family protein, partial [Aestuariivirga sp.]|nr:baseplate J/gp47 family protein [Aestuariivirga sp.]
MDPKFVIYRIIGNSLPPRHGTGETLNNLQFALENEPDLPFCEKRWLLNRVVDPEVEAKCIKLIRASGQKYHTIPLDEESYRNAFLDASGMPKALNLFAQESRSKPVSEESKEWIFRHKSLAAINLNDARNRAIELGRADALWTLPLDGWCYFTAEAWHSFTEGAARNKDALYGVLPLVRLKDNVQPRAMAAPPELVEEVRAFLDERRLLGTQLVVDGPAYVGVSVEASIVVQRHHSGEQVRNAVADRIRHYLDPLLGGPNGTGWPFGRDLYLSEMQSVVQAVQGVEYAQDVTLYQVDIQTGQSRAAGQKITIAEDVLLLSY